MLPKKTVRTACHQFMPPSMSEEASMYVGMHADMLTHSAAMDHTDHVRCPGVVGARSGFHSAPRSGIAEWSSAAPLAASPLARWAGMSVADVVIMFLPRMARMNTNKRGVRS